MSNALIDGDTGEIVTHGDLMKASFPIQKRALLFLFCKNRLRDVVTYQGAVNSGLAVCLLDEGMQEPFKHHLVGLYAPDYVYSDHPFEGYREIAPHLYQSGRAGPPLHEKLHLLLATSGTTGNPKLIRLSKENLLANGNSIIQSLQIDSNERAIASLPFHYSYGLSVLNSHLLAGASVVVTQASVAQNAFWEILDKYQCTSMAGVPYTYKIMERVGFLKRDFPSLRTLTQAGGRLDPALVVKFHQKVPRFFVMYGQTEATARIAYLPPEKLPEKAGAIGIAIPGGTLQVLDGELVYSGPNVMLGYAAAPEDLSKGDELKGVLHTGDLGYKDEEGIFYVTGRLKRISKVYGLRISLDDIESASSQFGTAAATTTDAEIRVFLEKGTPEICEKCKAHLSELYSLHPSTFRCTAIDALPRTSSGKVDYQALEEPLLQKLIQLTEYHRAHCPEYARLLDLFYKKTIASLADIPYLPVNLFKKRDLMSIRPEQIFKVLKSSGTTGSESKIYLDAETAERQTKALAEIMTAYLGNHRLPMLIIDHPYVIKERSSYSARGAALVGMMTFGRDYFYALDEEMNLDRAGVEAWLQRHQDEPVLLFGLTYMVWKFLLQIKEVSIQKGVLMHTGGWKKMQEVAVSNAQFKEMVRRKTQITKCHNFYGMVEQVGSVFVECEEGRLHTPDFADVIIRDPVTWKETGDEGVIQVLSTLPTSYPGHSLLTEDLGRYLGICPCGKGKSFEVTRRVPQAEIRGCSDTA